MEISTQQQFYASVLLIGDNQSHLGGTWQLWIERHCEVLYYLVAFTHFFSLSGRAVQLQPVSFFCYSSLKLWRFIYLVKETWLLELERNVNFQKQKFREYIYDIYTRNCLLLMVNTVKTCNEEWYLIFHSSKGMCKVTAAIEIRPDVLLSMLLKSWHMSLKHNLTWKAA